MEEDQLCIKRALSAIGTGTARLLYVARLLPEDQITRRILHAHTDYVEVLLITGGSGRFLIGERRYEIQAGDLVVYNSGVVHDEIAQDEKALSDYCVGVGGLCLPGLRENTLLPDTVPPVLHAGGVAEDLRRIYQIMYRALEENRPGCADFCHFLLLALLSQVLQLSGDAPRLSAAEPDSIGRKVQDYIDQHYQEPLTLQDIGAALHLSPYYLSHVFKETIGYSPVQYLLRRRIGEAQSLLITTDLPVAKISEEVGFETQNYFNLQFSRHVGIPPKKFRQGFREKQIKQPQEEG